LIKLIIAFLLGMIAQRIWLAKEPKPWMKSWTWSSNKTYLKIHDALCHWCPKRWYCERYQENNKGD
jgi:hypothetical protein